MKSFISITTLLFILITINASGQTKDFSGIWKRNDEKTDAGRLSINSIALSLEISEDSKVIAINGTNRNGKGDVSTYTDVLKLDGSQTERKAGAGQTKSISAKLSTDRKQLTVIGIYKDQQGNTTQSNKQTFFLSDDGKTLTISDERTFGGETYQLKDVFDKQ